MIRDKLNKEDRKFLVNLNVANRNFLADLSKFFMSIKMSFTSVILAGYGIFVSLTSIVLKDVFSLYVLFLFYADIFLICLLIIAWIWHTCTKEERKNIKNASNFNKQYLKYFKELYPNSDDEFI